jgi:hypothetical protein
MARPSWPRSALLVLLAGFSPGGPARGETFHTCAGFIDALPATVSSPGVWCLRKDLSTAITAGTAVTVSANNVTLDCNGFRIGGLAAGTGSNAHGIQASNRQNLVVRNCTLRGFHTGILVSGGGGHVVADNRLDGNLVYGIQVSALDSLVERNQVFDTGGHTASANAFGIASNGDIVGNRVSRLQAYLPNGDLHGIQARGAGTQVRGNAVSWFTALATGGQVKASYGIHVLGVDNVRVSDNHVSGGTVAGWGIYATLPRNFCLSNTVGGFATGKIHANCQGTGNATSD